MKIKDPSSYSELEFDIEKLTKSQKLRAIVYLIEEKHEFSGEPTHNRKTKDNYTDNDLVDSSEFFDAALRQ